MPNLFGMQKKNPLAALLMQQQEAPQGPTLEQLGADPKSPAVTGDYKPPVMIPNEPAPASMRAPLTRAPLPQAKSEGSDMGHFWGDFAKGAWDSEAGKGFRYYGDLAKRAVQFPGRLSHELGITQAVEREARKTFGLEEPLPMPNAAGKALLNKASPASGGEGPALVPGPDESFAEPMTTDEKEKNADLAFPGGGGVLGSAIGATQDMVQKYGKLAQSMEGAKVALRNEFQDTPELDEIIAKTEADLAFTRDDRKQPGVGEFIALALMNLANHDYKNNAYMILGTGEQQAKEARLEDRLSDLQGARATARMQGRQALRGMESQQRYQNLQAALKQEEANRKQGNEDREFGFKGQKLGYDKLMQELGQLRQQAGMETDPARKKKLQELIDKLDPYGKAQPQPAPKDDRQSRMFGDLMAGGGFA